MNYNLYSRVTVSSSGYFHAYVFMMRTCNGMTIMKIFLSLSERMCLTKAQPVPIRATVMNSSAPFSLKHVLQQNRLEQPLKNNYYYEYMNHAELRSV